MAYFLFLWKVKGPRLCWDNLQRLIGVIVYIEEHNCLPACLHISNNQLKYKTLNIFSPLNEYSTDWNWINSEKLSFSFVWNLDFKAERYNGSPTSMLPSNDILCPICLPLSCLLSFWMDAFFHLVWLMYVIVSSYPMFCIITTSEIYPLSFSQDYFLNVYHVGLEFSSKVFLDKLQTWTMPDRGDKTENPLVN